MKQVKIKSLLNGKNDTTSCIGFYNADAKEDFDSWYCKNQIYFLNNS
jgi:hypothetical protein